MRVLVNVKTGARVEKVVTHTTGELTVSIKALPIEGKANEALRKILAKHFHTSPSCVTLFRGQKSKQKVFDIL